MLELYERGLYVQAWRLGTRSQALEDWPGTEGRILAGRLAGNLGGERKSGAWYARAWRSDPTHPAAILYHAYGRWRRLGPLAAWDFLESRPGSGCWSGADRAEWLALRAQLLANFRDLERAEKELDEAERIQPGDAWLGYVRSSVLELADEYEAALLATGRALEAQPWFRPAVQQHAELLQLLDRTDEAIDFLNEARTHLESHAVEIQLALLLRERNLPGEAEEALGRAEEHAVLAEPGLLRWFTALRSNLAGMRGDDARSLELARLVETSFEKRVERMVARQATSAHRVLPVVFVRQHHMTCGPATLTALCRWFGREADHLEIAERICYGGTSSHSERSWAEERGFLVREFTLSVRTAQVLVDRGLPFGVETQEASSGHMQALIGYDDRREVLLVRDPYQPFVGEWPIQEFFERYRGTGPRAMLLLPRERAAEIEGLELGDEELFDALYRVESALRVHDHERASAECSALVERAPDHLVTLGTRRAMCAYEQDSLGLLAIATRLCELHPRCDRHQIMRLSLLRELGRKQERVALLEERARAPHCDPALLLLLAQEYSEDARTLDRAALLLKRALARTPLSTQGLRLRSMLHWARGQRAASIESSRFAACLEATQEDLAAHYFSCCLADGRGEEGLGFLRSRFERFARRSGLPAQGLYSALERLGRASEGLELLARAQVLREDDAGLALFSAAAHARYGRIEEARALARKAAARAPRRSTLAVEAEIELHACELARSLACWREFLSDDPHDADAWSACLALVRSTAGPAAELQEVRSLAARFPFQAEIQRRCIQRLGGEDPDEAIALLEALLARHPEDAWALREKAMRLGERGRCAEALASAELACAIAPREAASHVIHGIVLAAAGRSREALGAYRRAVELDADSIDAIRRFVIQAAEIGEGQNALEIARALLARPSTRGPGLFGWADAARGTLSAARMLEVLRGLCSAHPAAWQAHFVLARALLDADAPREALEAASAATERFPLQADLWSLRASAHARLEDSAGESAALERACALDPARTDALQVLATSRAHSGDTRGACELLIRAAAAAPLQIEVHEQLVDTLLSLGHKEEALQRAERATLLLPDEQRAWSLCRAAAAGLGREEQVLARLRALALAQPRNARLQLQLARLLDSGAHAEERRLALRRAQRLEPGNFQVLDLLAEQLAEEGRTEEARAELECFQPRPGQAPFLAGRKAWLLGVGGAKQEAISALKSILQTSPQYTWARHVLARFQHDLGLHEEALESAQRLLEIEPDNPHAVRMVVDAALQLKRRELAERVLVVAIERHRSDGEFAASLLDLQLGDKRWPEARAALERTRARIPAALRGPIEVRLLCAESEFERAFALLDDLCALPGLGSRSLWRATVPLDECGRTAELLRRLESRVRARDASAALGAVWMDRIVRQGQWDDAARRALELPGNPAVELGALRELLNRALDAGANHVVRRVMRKRRELLAGDAECWGYVCALLLQLQQYDDAIRWCADWRRPDAQPWMLYNLGLALWNAGQLELATEVSRCALSLAPDHSTERHRVLLACAALVRGDLAELEELHGKLKDPADRGFDSCMYRVLSVVLEMRASADTRAGFRAARARLAGLRPATRAAFRPPTPTQRVHRAAVRDIARIRGGLVARIWSWMSGI